MSKPYVIALYLRISSDDGFHGDSQSISGQRDLLNGYVRSHPELKDAKVIEFSDDGYSGTNFDRPGITELLELTKRGDIQCIIVKDFSRLGRNYIAVGEYVESIFPFLQVRFISINDGYDSAVQGDSTGDIGIAFKHLCNDYYCKDLSRKVKGGYQRKWAAGKVLSSYEVYGYRKDPEDKYRLVVDEQSSPIVRRIFDMALSGSKPSKIAAALNADGVPTPMQYLSQKRGIRTWSNLNKIWTGTEITRILRDVRYTGATTHSMYAVDHLGSRRSHRKPESEWIVHKGMHHPLVTDAEFERAQSCIRKINRSAGPRTPSPHSLPVPVRCGGCGHAMVKNGAKVMAYYCRYRNASASDSCFTGVIAVETLKTVLLSSIQRLQVIVMDWEKSINDRTASAHTDDLGRLRELQKEVDSLTQKSLLLYARHNEGGLSREEYLLYRKPLNDRIELLTRQIQALEQPVEQNAPDISPVQAILRDRPQPLAVSNELVKSLVECLIVHDENRVEIRWKFEDVFIDMLNDNMEAFDYGTSA